MDALSPIDPRALAAWLASTSATRGCEGHKLTVGAAPTRASGTVSSRGAVDEARAAPPVPAQRGGMRPDAVRHAMSSSRNMRRPPIVCNAACLNARGAAIDAHRACGLLSARR